MKNEILNKIFLFVASIYAVSITALAENKSATNDSSIVTKPAFKQEYNLITGERLKNESRIIKSVNAVKIVSTKTINFFGKDYSPNKPFIKSLINKIQLTNGSGKYSPLLGNVFYSNDRKYSALISSSSKDKFYNRIEVFNGSKSIWRYTDPDHILSLPVFLNEGKDLFLKVSDNDGVCFYEIVTTDGKLIYKEDGGKTNYLIRYKISENRNVVAFTVESSSRPEIHWFDSITNKSNTIPLHPFDSINTMSDDGSMLVVYEFKTKNFKMIECSGKDLWSFDGINVVPLNGESFIKNNSIFLSLKRDLSELDFINVQNGKTLIQLNLKDLKKDGFIFKKKFIQVSPDGNLIFISGFDDNENQGCVWAVNLDGKVLWTNCKQGRESLIDISKDGKTLKIYDGNTSQLSEEQSLEIVK